MAEGMNQMNQDELMLLDGFAKLSYHGSTSYL